jgi:ribonuclease/clavin/mitogillin
LLGRGPKRILFDTAQGLPQWATSLEKVLKDHSTSVSTCLLSHWHHDHISGVADLYTIQPDTKVYKNKPDLNPDNILDVSKVSPIEEGQTFTSEDFEVTAVHAPGHAADHMCLLVTASNDESEIGSLFTADNVLGHGTAVFENLGQYIATLSLLRSKIGPGKRAYPGHGAVIEDGGERIDGYIQHRKMREEEAVNVLRYGRTSNPEGSNEMGKEVVAKEWGSMEMVKVIYKDVPENLHEPAEHGLKMVLQKLKEDGTVTQGAGGKWRIGEKAIL